MQTVNLRRPARSARLASALAAVLLIAAATTTSADQLPIDGDVVTAGVQGLPDLVHLGDVDPGEILAVDVRFVLECANGAHVDEGQTVTLTPFGTGPEPGSVSAVPAEIGPVPASWPDDGSTNCTGVDPLETVKEDAVTLRAPLGDGTYQYDILYLRSYATAEFLAASSSPAATGISFTLRVVSNTPPTLLLPPDETVEGNASGGALADYTVTATDAQDDPDPTPTCWPAPGDLLPLGPNLVTCSVTDGHGVTVGGSFTITVEDSTRPTLEGLPDDIEVVTANPAGTAVSFATPTATDVVDSDPDVVCLPVSGSVFALGTTVVTCTAIDQSNNRATGRFDVTVRHAVVRWAEPIGEARAVGGNAGRTVPVKVDIALDGERALPTTPTLELSVCGQSTVVRAVPLAREGDGWKLNLDTAGLAGCHHAALTLAGTRLDGFTLQLKASDASQVSRAKP